MNLTRIIIAPFKLVYTNLLMICVIGLLYFGWTQRDDNYLSAETGTGYILGIVGGSLMLVLLLYPVSKRTTFLTRLIAIRYWFGLHMMLGIIGPLMILFHSNFHLGSTNSNVALICMLLVAGSGLVGRYIYTRIHHGLYGTRMTLKELKLETKNNHSELLTMYATDEVLKNHLGLLLKNMEEKAIQPYKGLIKSLSHIISLAVNARRLNKEVIQLIKINGQNNQQAMTLQNSKTVITSVRRYTVALRRAAAFTLYEKLFSLWHVLHLPLFFMMIITAVIHIFAVHLY